MIWRLFPVVWEVGSPLSHWDTRCHVEALRLFLTNLRFLDICTIFLGHLRLFLSIWDWRHLLTGLKVSQVVCLRCFKLDLRHCFLFVTLLPWLRLLVSHVVHADLEHSRQLKMTSNSDSFVSPSQVLHNKHAPPYSALEIYFRFCLIELRPSPSQVQTFVALGQSSVVVKDLARP